MVCGRLATATLFSLCLCFTPDCLCAIWHVSVSVTSSGDGTSWETAFQNIQEGIDSASDGDTIIVAEGTYLQNIHFKGKNIILRSTDPLDPRVVQNTVIDGNQAGSVVTLSGTERYGCVLEGFTLHNAKAESAGGICSGSYAVKRDRGLYD